MLVFCVLSQAWLLLSGLTLGLCCPFLPHLRHLSASQVAHFKDYIPQAFPGGHSMILDSEVLLIDTKTGKPLPFGTLGVHKVLPQSQACRNERVCAHVRVSVCALALDGGESITHLGWGLFFVSEVFLKLALSLDVFFVLYIKGAGNGNSESG